MSKKVISILLICCFLSGALVIGVGATDSDTPAWNFDANGQLTVNAASALADYASAQDTPWNLFTSLITSVSVDPSISYIGAYSLNNLNATVHIENGNTEIAEHAFDNVGTDFVIVSVFNSPVHTYATEHGLAFEGITVASGECGATAGWNIYTDGTLHIHGSGAMTDYYRDPASTPWYSYKSTITSVVVDETITFVSPYTVFSASACMSATIYGENTQVSTTAFQMVNANFTIYGHLNSSAQEVAQAREYTFVPFTIASGSCGANAAWTLYPNGLLEISGHGAMESQTEPIKVPFLNYASQIITIEIGEGITKIGNFTYFPTFTNCTSLIIWNPDIVFDQYALTGVSSSSGFEIRGYSGSTAQKYANEKSLSFAPCSPILAMDSCGETAYWQLHENGVLRIYGSGAMQTNARPPWYNYASLIKTIDICEEITEISRVVIPSETNCKKLIIRNPSAVIAEKAVSRTDKNLTIYGELGSTAETYAHEKGYYFTGIMLDYGSYGENNNLTWTFYKGGTLKITGSDVMNNLNTYPDRVPWYQYTDSIISIEIGSTVTKISEFSFFYLRNCTSITILNSQATIENAAISMCSEELVIYGYAGSTAETYATTKSIPFIALD